MKILSMPVDDGGCGWYRVIQPLEMIKATSDNETHVVNTQKDDGNSVYEALLAADIVVIRPGAEQGMRALKEKYPEIKAKWVMDIDDNIELISPYSEHYGEYGMYDFYDKNIGKWIWKDKVNMDILNNRLKVASLLKGMGEVDLITVTTNKLREYALKYNKNVAILPNCVNLEKWRKLPMYPNKRLQVGWSGGISHYEDWFSIKEPLNKLMKDFDFDLVLGGSNFEGVIDPKYRHRIKFYHWVEPRANNYLLMSKNFDIGVIPLAHLPFNYFKSSVKWYEQCALGVPNVVSNVLPYSEDFTDGVNALGYNDEKDFYTQTAKLLTDPKLRNKLGYNARKWVEKNRDAKKNAKLWIDAYQSLL